MAPARRAGNPARSPIRLTFDDMVPPSSMCRGIDDDPSEQTGHGSYHNRSDECARPVPAISYHAGPCRPATTPERCGGPGSGRNRPIAVALEVADSLGIQRPSIEHSAMPEPPRALGRERHRRTRAPHPRGGAPGAGSPGAGRRPPGKPVLGAGPGRAVSPRRAPGRERRATGAGRERPARTGPYRCCPGIGSRKPWSKLEGERSSRDGPRPATDRRASQFGHLSRRAAPAGGIRVE